VILVSDGSPATWTNTILSRLHAAPRSGSRQRIVDEAVERGADNATAVVVRRQ